jgi:ribA/ribD-fused uncharacterized protein
MRFRGRFYFLSNFYPLPQGITVKDLTYKSAEAAFQGEKCRFAGRYDLAKRISELGPHDAVHAKRIGGRSNLCMTQDQCRLWNATSTEVMRECLEQKFKDPELMRRLRSVQGPIVEDTSDRRFPDRIWGVDDKGEGENRLGRLLMEIRDRA